ncbi:unnamed protein product [Meganyctiphanes norvegica]|uniref:Uncharacterized protein n=1 Tax=Meganyctiphanes norvegica TaxID=48144 RepID=A0AAV2RDA6_MEGNR
MEDFNETIDRALKLPSNAEKWHAKELKEVIEKIKTLYKKGLLTTEMFSRFKNIINTLSMNTRGKSLSDSHGKRYLIGDLITMVNDVKYSDDQGNLEQNKQPNLNIIDDILDKSKKARKCGDWFLHVASNHECLSDDVCNSWCNMSLELGNYADFIDDILGLDKGLDKVEMYNLYLEYKRCIEHHLREIHHFEMRLEKSSRRYKCLEANEPKFKRCRSCSSEHKTPLCEMCGWPTQWLKTFQKNGVHIREASDWTDKYIWYNEMNTIPNKICWGTRDQVAEN